MTERFIIGNIEMLFMAYLALRGENVGIIVKNNSILFWAPKDGKPQAGVSDEASLPPETMRVEIPNRHIRQITVRGMRAWQNPRYSSSELGLPYYGARGPVLVELRPTVRGVDTIVEAAISSGVGLLKRTGITIEEHLAKFM